MNVDPAIVALVFGAVNTIAVLGGGFFLAGSVTARIGRIETDVSETKKLLVSAAVDASRLSRAERDIDGLRRGVGFIRDNGASAVDREYKG